MAIKLLSINGHPLSTGGSIALGFELLPSSYLAFSSNDEFTLGVSAKNWDGTLEYSTDAINWSTWEDASITATGKNVYLRGTNNTRFATGSNTANYTTFQIVGSADVKCSGNIENLLDYQTVKAGNHPTMANYTFVYLFKDCSSLTSAPELPATTLANMCYYEMFSGCTSLTAAPELPATTLAQDCYGSMFQNCTSLTTAPELPVTTLASSCYSWMFYGCTALTTAPELPATTLAEYCYYGMFRNCTSLTTAPALPATTLTTQCYQYMFRNCTSLTTAPALPATTLAEYCYYGMFYGCTSLRTVPELPATTLTNYCYYGMFNGCTGIHLSATQTDNYNKSYRIPSEGTGATATGDLGDMFKNTGGTFTGTPEINTTYYLHKDNSIVPPQPSDLPQTWLINENLTDYITFTDINFTSNNSNFSGITHTIESTALPSGKGTAYVEFLQYMRAGTSGETNVASRDRLNSNPWNDTSWTDQAYRTIAFTEQEPTGDLLTWLSNNAVRSN